jgi:hypothetical protein
MMNTFLHAQGFDVWKSVVDGYKAPTTPPSNRDGNKLNEKKTNAKGTIVNSLVDSIFVKVMNCDSEKYCWDKL